MSCEKKKNWPLAPAPYPDLNTYSIFACKDNDSNTSDGLILSSYKILANFLYWWEMIFDLTVILSNFFSLLSAFDAVLFKLSSIMSKLLSSYSFIIGEEACRIFFIERLSDYWVTKLLNISSFYELKSNMTFDWPLSSYSFSCLYFLAIFHSSTSWR